MGCWTRPGFRIFNICLPLELLGIHIQYIIISYHVYRPLGIVINFDDL